MEYSIVLMDKTVIQINKQERDLVLEAALSDSKAFLLERTGEVIAIRPMPTILLTSRIHEEQGRQAQLKGRWICEYGTSHDLQRDTCDCKPKKSTTHDYTEGVWGGTPRVVYEPNKRLLNHSAYKKMVEKYIAEKSLPQLSDQEQNEARKEIQERSSN